jgi:putative ABC transport system substrate-binding protein
MEEKSVFSRSLILIMALITIALCLLWSCQQTEVRKKNYLIGIINPNTGTQDINNGFIQELKENGFVEGENTTLLRYDSNFEIDEVIHDMVARNVDLIFTVTTPATRKAKKATQGKNIPVVYAMQDPVASGIITSFTQHDADITGVQIRGSIPKTLEWMLTVSPGIKNLFVPVKYDTKAANQSLEDLQKSATTLGVKLSLVEVIGSGAAQSDRGVTISYGMVAEKTGRQAGRLANLILQGKNPADIPSEITEFFIGVNLQTAEATNVEISAEVLQQADIIIR